MMKYELNKDGARLAFKDFCNTVNGNAKWIREYEIILNTLLVAARDTESRIKAKEYRSAYDRLSEQKMEKVADNQLVFTWYLPKSATVAQNKAKVMQGRAMLKQFGLVH